jgi:arginine deiminase
MTALSVYSEVGRLRRVLVHEPGPEIDRMVPDMMEELLFDDILFGERAREEHRLLRRLLEHLGISTFDSFDLLVEALGADGAQEWFLRAVKPSVAAPVFERLEAASAEDLARIFVGGLRRRDDLDVLAGGDLFEILPTPNWCFQRDPQIIVGDGVIFSSMATPTRARETLLARTVFRFHPEYRSAPVLLDPMAVDEDQPMYLGLHRPRFEGGDVMVLSNEVIAVGYSERTSRAGVRQLAQALHRREGGPRYLVVVALPHKRAYMHLDTVLTQIDRGHCLAFPQVILPGFDDTASIYEFDLHHEDPRPEARGDLLSALRERSIDLEPIACGGDDVIAQQREQWTDGANALAVAPGVCIAYDRNQRTIEALSQSGFDIVPATELLAGRVLVDLADPRPTCILMPSTELSRARGGPHCLTHALERDALA